MLCTQSLRVDIRSVISALILHKESGGKTMKTFYYNGTIITMKESALYAEAVCVEDGRIRAVGNADQVMKLKTDTDQVIDLQGNTMLPGFVDAHSHFVGAANAMTQCDLSSCSNFAQIVEAMKDFAKKRNLSKDAWIMGCNYDQNFLDERRHPDRSVLDEISRTNPVVIIHASSHMGVANSMGLT